MLDNNGHIDFQVQYELSWILAINLTFIEFEQEHSVYV